MKIDEIAIEFVKPGIRDDAHFFCYEPKAQKIKYFSFYSRNFHSSHSFNGVKLAKSHIFQRQF